MSSSTECERAPTECGPEPGRHPVYEATVGETQKGKIIAKIEKFPATWKKSRVVVHDKNLGDLYATRASMMEIDRRNDCPFRRSGFASTSEDARKLVEKMLKELREQLENQKIRSDNLLAQLDAGINTKELEAERVVSAQNLKL